MTAAGQVFKTDGQLRGVIQQHLRTVKDGPGRFTNLEQFRRGFQNLVYRTGYELEQLGNFGQTIQGFLVGHLGNFHRRIAFQHGGQYAAEQAGVTAEHVGGLYRVFVTGQYLVDRAEDSFSQQRLALGHGNLSRRRFALQQNLDNLFVLNLQLRNGFRQGSRYLVQRQYGLLTGQDGIGVLPHAVPFLLHTGHFSLYCVRCRRDAIDVITFYQRIPALGVVVTGVLQQGKGFCLAGRRFGGRFRDPLRQYAQFAGVTDVLLVVAGLGVEVREVGEQQHDGNDQDNKESRDQRVAAHTS